MVINVLTEHAAGVPAAEALLLKGPESWCDRMVRAAELAHVSARERTLTLHRTRSASHRVRSS
jgi:hypothetical protein